MFADGASKVSQNAAAGRPQPATPVELRLLELKLDALIELRLLDVLADELDELAELRLLLEALTETLLLLLLGRLLLLLRFELKLERLPGELCVKELTELLVMALETLLERDLAVELIAVSELTALEELTEELNSPDEVPPPPQADKLITTR